MKCLLLAMTGFGNSVLTGLLKTNCFDKIIVITRTEKGTFPHYPCEQLSDFCIRHNIEYKTELILNRGSTIKKLSQIKFDIIISATFNQIIPNQIIKSAKISAINIHPSLLPYYKGATPTNWTIIHGEKQTGITFHELTEVLDGGDIIFQKKIIIGSLTDGQLRRRLANLAERYIGDFLNCLINNSLVPFKQDKCKGSYFPNVTTKESLRMLQTGTFSFSNIKKGLTPYPGIGFFDMAPK
jgi:methionyl-tRNA formyltransferase